MRKCLHRSRLGHLGMYPAGAHLTLTTAGVDDATEAKIFNATHPAGHTASGWYGFDGPMSVDFSRQLAPGRNRIVLTHLDDNPHSRRLHSVSLAYDGAPVDTCR